MIIENDKWKVFLEKNLDLQEEPQPSIFQPMQPTEQAPCMNLQVLREISDLTEELSHNHPRDDRERLVLEAFIHSLDAITCLMEALALQGE